MIDVLLVEDNEQHKEQISSILSDYSFFNIIDASDAQEAIDKVDEYNIDLILLGIKTAYMNGLGYLPELREKANSKSISIVEISSNDTSNDENLGSETNEYISKSSSGQNFESFIEYHFN